MHSNKGTVVGYDKLVLATGSYPGCRPFAGSQHHGASSIAPSDLKAIRSAAKSGKSGVVIGAACLARGGEASKALGLETHVVEFAPRTDGRAARRSGRPAAAPQD